MVYISCLWPLKQQFAIYSKGKEARLCYMGHALMENRHGLVVDAHVTEATGTAERDRAVAMVGERSCTHQITFGADKGYDARHFVADLREVNGTPRRGPE